MSQAPPKQGFHFPRTLLLIEIERRCALTDCGAKNRISLTKTEAIAYRGFECFQCAGWNNDSLEPQELPDSWAPDARSEFR
jgi:hypothetical protein